MRLQTALPKSVRGVACISRFFFFFFSFILLFDNIWWKRVRNTAVGKAIKHVWIIFSLIFRVRTYIVPLLARWSANVSLTLSFQRCQFLKSRPHVLISYSKLNKQKCSPALPENIRGAAYVSNQNSVIRRTLQQPQHKSSDHYGNIVKFI